MNPRAQIGVLICTSYIFLPVAETGKFDLKVSLFSGG